MSNEKGQILIISTLFLSIVVFLMSVIINMFISNNFIIQKRYQQQISFNLAEAGIEKAIHELNSDANYSGETTNLSNGTFVTNVTNLASNLKQVESTGYFPSNLNPKTEKKIKVQIRIDTTDIAFNFGIQVGEGGLELQNGAVINGNLYSNGSVFGGGDVAGTAQVATGSQFSISHEVQSSGSDGEYRFGHSLNELDAAQSFKLSETASITKVSLRLKKACEDNKKSQCPPNLTLRILGDASSSPDSNNDLATGTLQQSLVSMNDFEWIDITIDTPAILNADTPYWITLSPSDVYPSGNNDRYWWWAKDKNQGYGNGKAKYTPDWDASDPTWTEIIGDLNFRVFLGTDSTFIDNIHVTEDTYAYEIKNATIDQEAYYMVIDEATTVNGSACPNPACHPDTLAPSLQNLPISQANINDFKNEAIAGGTIVGDYLVDDTINTLGPVEITGNLTVVNNGELKVTGTIYVHGQIDMNNNGLMYLDSGYGPLSGIVVNDDEIDVKNNARFCGSGWDSGTETCDTSNGSYIMLLSTSNKQEVTGPAIDVRNNTEGVLFYANQGAITVTNNVNLYEAVGYKMLIKNNAIVTYESGLADVKFTSGPGASWNLKPGTWQEL